MMCYTDSQICLAWIRATQKEFKTFVQNRLLEIRGIVTPDKWNYCPSEENPADLLTRCKVRGLFTNLCLNGPSFLARDVNGDACFPSCCVPENIIETDVFTQELKYPLIGANENPLEIVSHLSIIAATKEICLSEVICIKTIAIF